MVKWKAMYEELNKEHRELIAALRNLNYEKILPHQFFMNKGQFQMEDVGDGKVFVTNLKHPMQKLMGAE